MPDAAVFDVLTDADEANKFVKDYLMANLLDKFDQFLFDEGRLYGFVVHSQLASPGETERLTKLEARIKKDKSRYTWSDDELSGGSSNRKTKGKNYKNANVGKSQSSRKDRATRCKRK